MKKTTILLMGLAIAAISIIASCKKDDKKTNTNNTPSSYKCNSCVVSPDAQAADDHKSSGIYKGVLIGSSGTIKFSINSTTKSVSAVMVIDGETINLSSSVAWVDGKPYVAPFTGTMGGKTVTINFSVNFDGGSPTITSSDIPGHPSAVLSIVKETSSALIECFEGTYSTTEPENGTFNILLSRTLGQYGGVSRETGSSSTNDAEGTIKDGYLYDEDGKKIGSLSGDVISGTFVDNAGNTVTINGKRTL